MTSTGKRIRILVAEDSPVQCELQVHLFSSDPELEVVGIARDGQEAVERVRLCRPDVVTMDFHMPVMNGAEATRLIMETHPVPIVVVSGSSVPGEVAETFRTLDAGALVIVEKPADLGGEAARKLLETVKLMAEVKVVRRWPEARKSAPAAAAHFQPKAAFPVALVAMGASTGGPPVLQTILSALARDFPAPVAIVQHISPGFTEGFAEWLTEASGFPTRVATQGERLDRGRAYVAPEGRHMTVRADGRGGCRIELNAGPLENGHRPAVAPFFRSVAAAVGDKAVGVLLTGMGKDGAAELRALRERGAVTIAQDRESSVVPGMPGEAVRLDAATHVLPPAQIGELLAVLARRRHDPGFK